MHSDWFTTKALLDSLLSDAEQARRLSADPLRFPRRYDHAADRRVAAFVAASYAFGNAQSIGRYLQYLLGELDQLGGPATAVRNLPVRAWRQYRWIHSEDTHAFLTALGRVPLELGPGTLEDALADLADALRREAERVAGEPRRGIRFLIPNLRGQGASKRWWMLARWMIRTESPDLGLWADRSPAELLPPLDTHVHRISALLGWTDRPRADRKAMHDVAAALRALDPEDPIRYDLALAHIGISDGCRGRWHEAVCPSCPLQPSCAAASGG